jgi:CBS domain containing-hemolysin-like protein
MKETRLFQRILSGSRALAAIWLSLIGTPAFASFLSGEALDTFADWIALFVIVFVPIVLIVLFWMVHVLPEKIAEKRHHPQKDAIHTLCLLSLVFGGLLWPFAWLWAYTKPVAYRLAYGTERHDDYYLEQAEKARSGGLLGDEIAHLRDELDSMARRGALPPQLKRLREDLDALRAEVRGDTPPQA